MKVKILLIIFTIFCAVFSQAALAGITTDPTDNAGSARYLGMGKAYVAVSDDSDAVFVNQAGLAGVTVFSATGMFYRKVLSDCYYSIGSMAIPTNYGTFGFGFIQSGIDDIVDTTDPDNLKSTNYYDSAVEASYGTSLSRLWGDERRVYVGGSLKFFSRGFVGSVDETAQGFNADIGIKYIPYNWLSLGIMKHNLLSPSQGGVIYWHTGEKEQLNSPTKVGAAVRFFDNRQVVAVDYNASSHPGQPSTMHLGTEYSVLENFKVRGGLDQILDAASDTGTSWNISLGLGVKFGSFSLDYAYHPYFDDPENVTHYISLSYKNDLDLVKTKFYSSTRQDVGLLDKIPGKTYDDLGNIVKNEPSDFSLTSADSFSSKKRLTTVDYKVPNYNKMYIAYLDAGEAAITKVPTIEEPAVYKHGDIVPIVSTATVNVETLLTIMPPSTGITLTYDKKTDVWYGVWKVPNDMPAGKYYARIIAIDFEGNRKEVSTIPFIVEGAVISEEAKPEEVKIAEVQEPTAEVKAEGISWINVFAFMERNLGRRLRSDQGLSRGELVYIIAKAKGYDLAKEVSQSPFMDISLTQWAPRAINAISMCVENKIIDATPNEPFRPNDKVSFAELLAIIVRMENLKDAGSPAPSEHWAMASVRALIFAKLLSLDEMAENKDTLISKVKLKRICELLSRTQTFKNALTPVKQPDLE